jgi:hypothetical protein
MLGRALIVTSLAFQSSPAPAERPASPQPVAIVAAMAGSGSIKPTRGSSQPLSLYEWIRPDVIVEVAPQGSVELIMLDGRHYVLMGGARAKLSATTLTALRGSVTEAPAVPQLTLLAPIAGKAPRDAGAVRLRAPGIAKLNPCGPVVTRRDATVLQFAPVDAAAQYEIQVRTSDGQEVFARTIDKPPVAIPPGTLAGATTYVWTVRAIGNVPATRSEAQFTTLPDNVDTARRTFAAALPPEATGVLGGIDFHLGLLNEATEELTAAAKHSPGDAGVVREAAQVRAALAAACQ